MVKKAFIVLLLGVSALVALSYIREPGGINKNSTTYGLAPSLPGKIVYTRGYALWMYSGGKQQQLTAGPKDRQDKRDTMPNLSPDGSEIIYTRLDEGYSDIYKLTVSDPKDTTPLTNNKPDVEVGKVGANGEPGYTELALWALYPTWSPDGERIAYTSDVRTEYPGLFSMDPGGDNVRKLDYLDHSQQTVERPAYSPDGDKLAVANYLTNNGKGQIWVLNLVSGKWIELTNSADGAYDPAWSPDGEWLAFAMREGTATNVYVVPTDAQKWPGEYPTPVKLTNSNASRAPAWSPDGKHLAYISLKSSSFDLYSADFAANPSGNPFLQNTSQLTDKANVDASSGLSWGK